MNEQKGRQLIAAISGTLLLWLLIGRRRAAMLGTLPNLVEDRIVVPMDAWMRENRNPANGNPASEDRMTRKVGRNRKVSVNGKLYGPVDPSLVGEQVEVEERDDQIVIWHDGAEVAQFEQQ